LKQYYDARAREYDDWYLGRGLFGRRERPEWDEAMRALESSLARLPAAPTLDVACGTGFLTRHLPGAITALDRSARMLEIAREPSRRTDWPSWAKAAAWPTRVLNDGSSFDVYKRYFDAQELVEELGGGSVLHQSPWFVMVAS
jgi:ubiquinone/menaquinone biosynthesis C-methylase UbiE